jgi:hypothetical protein|tara:strand:+ start:458 stop:997 length:540 start_codon:yes stop_codon:yes gene_type:complete
MLLYTDNFFTKEKLKFYQSLFLKTPLKFVKDPTGLHYGFRSDVFELIPEYSEYIKDIKKTIFKKLKIINTYKKTGTFFHKRKPTKNGENLEDVRRIHKDYNSYWNCLIYLSGKESLGNGTSFYTLENNNYTVSSSIAFKENRAILFRGNIWHGTTQVYDPNSTWRDSINVFFERKQNGK